MHELQPNQLDRVLPLFDAPYARFVVESMQQGHTPSRVWVNNIETPREALIWNTTYSLYLGGAWRDDAFYDALRPLILEEIMPKLRELRIFKLHDLRTDWDDPFFEFFPSVVPTLIPREDTRVLYRLDTAPPTPPPTIPEDFSLRPIDRALLDSSLEHVDEVREEIEGQWVSVERFLEYGFGYVIKHLNEIVCWCTSEYVSDHQCGIGIATEAAFQKRGLATITAHAFATHARAKGWTVYWDAWRANTPSTRVAEKVGFRKVEEYSAVVVWLDSNA